MSVYEKLNSIQTTLKAPKNQFNAFGKYKYRNAEDILESLKPHLQEQKCVINLSDEIVNTNERYYIKAIATLIDMEDYSQVSASGWAREEENKKGMDGSQITGASSSYARKYALNGLFAIDDNKDSDDTNKHGKDNGKASDKVQLENLKIELKDFEDFEELKSKMVPIRDDYVSKGVLQKDAEAEIKKRISQLKGE